MPARPAWPAWSESLRPKTGEMTQRIGRFYTGRPSWRTWVRGVRRRLGDASLPLSEEEQLIKVKQDFLARQRAAGKAEEPVYALRFAHPLPPVLLAADGKTTVRYLPVPKSGTTSTLNWLLEMTGEAAHRGWQDEEHWFQRPVYHAEEFNFDGPRVCVTLNEKCIAVHKYLQRGFFAPQPHADVRFCVVRDPVERFLALLNQFQIAVFRREKRLPPLDGAWIDSFLDVLGAFYETLGSASAISRDDMMGRMAVFFDEAGFAFAPQYFHLGFRQTDFLGRDATWYTHVFALRDLAPAHKLLSELAGKPLSSLRANSSQERKDVFAARGLKLARPQLTAAQKRKIETAYAEDYRVFGRWFEA